MKGDSVNTIELVSMESLMKEHENPEWKKKVSMQDLILPGSVEILEAAKADDARLLRETDNKLFLRMFLKYLQKNHHKIYLLAASQEELVKAEEALARYNQGIRVVGDAVIHLEDGELTDADRIHGIVNAVNGSEADCILSVLPSPAQEDFIEQNRALIDKAYSKANSESGSVVLKEIHKLDTELKKTIIRHGELIRETIELQNIADEMIGRAKLRKLRPVFQFRDALQKAMKQDRADRLGMLMAPLFMPKLTKSFAVESVDRMLESKADNADYGEKIEKKQVDVDYVYEDELEEERIGENFGRLFEELLEQLWKHGKTTLPELMAIYEIKFGKEIYRNGDVYSFLVHLAQKNRYEFKHMQDKQDTFLEGIVMNRLSVEKKDKYGNMVFEIFFDVGNILNFGDTKDESFSITDMRFETV